MINLPLLLFVLSISTIILIFYLILASFIGHIKTSKEAGITVLCWYGGTVIGHIVYRLFL